MNSQTKSVRRGINKYWLAGITISTALVLTRPDQLTKVYAVTNQYDWVKQEDLDPLGGDYTSAARSADGSALILGTDGGGGDLNESPLLVSSNSGATWQNVADDIDPGVQNSWTSVDVSDDGDTMVAVSSEGYDLGEADWIDGKVFISEDGGDNWEDITPISGNDWNHVAVSGDGTKIAATRWGDGQLYVTENGGGDWDNFYVNDGEDDTWNLKSVSLSDNGDKILVGGENDGDPFTKLFYSTDDGDNWANISPDSEDEVWSSTSTLSDDGSKIVVSAMGSGVDHVFISEDDGLNWDDITPEAETETENYWVATAISDDGGKIAIADSFEDDRKMYITSDDGANWNQEDPGLDGEDSNLWQAVDFNEDGTELVVAGQQNVYLSGLLEAPVVTLDNAKNGKTVTITTPAGTTITCHTAVKESGLDAKDSGYAYPLGLVDFCFSSSDESNEVSLIFVTDLNPDEVTVRKYNPDSDSYANVTEASVSETTYGGHHALLVTYTIVDNGPLDTDADDGEIADPVGLAVADTTVPNTGLGPNQSTNMVGNLIAGTALATGLALSLVRRKATNKITSKK